MAAKLFIQVRVETLSPKHRQQTPRRHLEPCHKFTNRQSQSPDQLIPQSPDVFTRA
jgi:hypothetical protein